MRADEKGGGSEEPPPRLRSPLRGRVGVRAAVDVRVAEVWQRACLLYGRRHFLLFLFLRTSLHSFLLAARFLCLSSLSSGFDRLFVQFLTVLVDGRTIGRVAHVVPDRRTVGPSGGCVDVVTEELGGQVVLARTPRVTGYTPVDLREAFGVGTF